MVNSILENVLVNLFVFLFLNLLFVADPKRLVFIYSFKFNSLNISGGCSVNWVFDFFVIEFFSFCLPFLSCLFDLCLDFCLCFFYFFLCSYNSFQIDGIVDKTAISFNQTLKLVIFAILTGIFFEEQPDNGASFKFNWIVKLHCKNIGCWRSPFVLGIIVVFGDDLYSWCN